MAEWQWRFHFKEFDIDLISADDEDEDMLKELQDLSFPYFQCEGSSYWFNETHLIFVERKKLDHFQDWDEENE